jgi:hypothetical protein
MKTEKTEGLIGAFCHRRGGFASTEDVSKKFCAPHKILLERQTSGVYMADCAASQQKEIVKVAGGDIEFGRCHSPSSPGDQANDD